MKQQITQKIHSIDNTHESAALVNPGELFVVKVQNAFGESFESESDFLAFMQDDEKKKRLSHPCTGPIEVLTSEQNISLAIHVVDIKASKGFQCISKSTGFLKDKFHERSCAIIDFENASHVQYNKDVVISTMPTIGFISTLDATKRSAGRACENGGNIDLNYLEKNSTIYLPVNDTRARIAVGDLHICQGNGEAAGIAIEADGEVTLKIDIVDKINFPIIHTPRRLVIVGWGDSIDAALKRCTENSLIYLKRVFPLCHWSDVDIYKFISAEGNLVLGNSTGNVITCGMVFHVPRVLNKYEFPIFG